MKVRFATQLLSKTVAAGIITLVENNILGASAIATCNFIFCMDSLFDMFNSSNRAETKKFKQAFENAEYQVDFLIRVREYLSTFQLYNNLSGKNVTNLVKTFKCWISNINFLLQIWQFLQTNFNGILYLLLRRFGTDALEHFFEKLRSIIGNSNNPTAIQCCQCFRKKFIIGENLPDLTTGNCSPESNRDDFILKFIEKNAAFLQNLESAQACCVTPDVDISDLEFNNNTVFQKNILDLNALRYVCGYLIRKCILKHSCETCLQFSKQYTDIDKTSIYCHHRAYNPSLERPFGSLLMPNDYFVSYIAKLEDLFFKNLEELLVQKNIIAKYIKLFQLVEFQHPCPNFDKSYLMRLYARVRLFYTLKFINRNFRNQSGRSKTIILSHN